MRVVKSAGKLVRIIEINQRTNLVPWDAEQFVQILGVEALSKRRMAQWVLLAHTFEMFLRCDPTLLYGQVGTKNTVNACFG